MLTAILFCQSHLVGYRFFCKREIFFALENASIANIESTSLNEQVSLATRSYKAIIISLLLMINFVAAIYY